MDYRVRHVERRLKQLASHFKVVLVTGARQVGKSTLLAHTFPDVKVIVFEPTRDLYGARADPDLFLDSFSPPVILDEIQFAPELLPALKRRVDASAGAGLYFLSGSQNLTVLRTVAESMAGRVGIINLEPMTILEMLGLGDRAGWLESYLDEPASLLARFSGTRADPGNLNRFLWRGCLPGLLDLPDDLMPDYFRSYVQTYIERDVLTLHDVRELASFDRFLGLAGALTSQEINTSQIGREVGVTPATARRWLDLLTRTYQWLELSPYHGNTIKRLTGKRKGYLRDTGTACSLQRISSPEALAVSPMRGALFGTWAVGEIHRQFGALAVEPHAYHWRTRAGAEVDVVLERDGRLYPIEVKCKSNLTGHDTRGLRAFQETYPRVPIMTGLILYAGTECYRVNENTIALPWNAVLDTR